MLVILILVLGAFALGADSHTQPPNISGAWRVDLDLSHGADRWDKTYRVIVSQSDDGIVFHYFDRKGNDLGTDHFVPDGRERPRWKTHVEHAFATVKWHGNKLLIETCSVQSSYFNEMYYTDDAWELTNDDMLGHKLTDGKMMLFRRESRDRTPHADTSQLDPSDIPKYSPR